ncbi:hypothetical protein [Cysteiniphilum sp. JM-1]|uniref:hypothetical protein n=1 Tax=Cysteiniphilum sp. JM-1 TaxID=2610891 RepID=UPI00168D3B6F|nr:hypothetical protein [Cysteiniphilum sp. JM-1]
MESEAINKKRDIKYLNKINERKQEFAKLAKGLSKLNNNVSDDDNALHPIR